MAKAEPACVIIVNDNQIENNIQRPTKISSIKYGRRTN